MGDVELSAASDPPRPPQSPPVHRLDVIAPHTCVDVVHGTLEQLVGVRMELMHGANVNDPAAFRSATYAERKGRR